VDRFLRLSEVRNRVPFSRASTYRLIASGEFPKPCPLGARAVGWRESEVNAWMASRVEQRDGSGGAL
jgi:prophage regulatory protein